MRRVRELAAALVTAVAVAGCSSVPGGPHDSGAAQTGAGAPADVAVPPAAGAASRPSLRLGYVPSIQDGIALLGLQKQYYLADLGSGTALDAVAYTNAGAESRALARGDLDAAYLDPVEAISAWQASHGDFRIVAGASSAGGRAMVVLVVSGKLLADNSELEGLLKGEIQAAEFLTSSPISARAAIGAELALLGAKLSGRQLNAAFEHVTFGTDLLATSIAGQAQQAAAAGSLKPVSGLSNIYDVTILNELLRSAGLLQVTT